ncbi:sugar ABC transporter substrate-binding protein [Herbiconiux daphne]|uniref:Substrate-binding domain-containing protein n=1 Tax=Herbiconiux daphne TaxID=2970914 RepID=A0ABT2H3J3_9MICO|nr:substrate-binding domain-containing protein [Herbiconiux daphne]MCS5734495.1 substrate-binding domain-containing protein [Herbiconiux daphne]
MKKKILIAGAALATATVVLTGCSSGSAGSTASGDGAFTLSFANYAESVPLFNVIHTTLDDINTDESGLDINWYDNDGDAATMLQNVQLMIDEQPDAIALYPVSAATDGVSQLLEQGGIPCVSINIDTPACSFLNIDNKQLGIETGTIIGNLAKEKGWDASNTTILLGQNAAAGEQVNDCVRYFYSTIADILGLEVVDVSDITPTTTTIGANAIQFDGQSTLQPSFDAIQGLIPSIPAGNNVILYTVNNDSTSGALRALEDAGLGGDDTLMIGGLGGDTTGITALANDPRWVAEGDIFVSYWGEYAAAMAEALAAGVTPPADVTPLPQKVLDKNDYLDYHPDGTTAVTMLPALVPDNEFLADTSFLKFVGNVDGVE